MSEKSWRELLTTALHLHGEKWSDVESHTLTKRQLDKRFDIGYGIAKGDPFTLWTAKWVYFPAQYDGAEWVACVPRHPNKIATHHIGGG